MRIRKKLLGRTSWYRSRKKTKDQKIGDENRRQKAPHGGGRKVKTRAVLFVEQTPGGELSRRIKDLIHRLEPTLGYTIKVVERTGQSVQSVFSQTAIWSGSKCGRDDCVTCNQEGEEIAP